MPYKKCEHGIQKCRCKQCGGSNLCQHDRQKAACKDCGTLKYKYCEHDKVKKDCKICCSSNVCQHGKWKRMCRECGGSAFCQHGKWKIRCIECDGRALCHHGISKCKCNKCGGSSYCIHGKQKVVCIICGGSSLCKSSWCETQVNNKKYEGYCMPCFVNNPENGDKPAMQNYKTKEKEVVDCIRESFPNFTWVADKRIQDGCSRRRPDLLLDMGSHIIIVEIDENRHDYYDCICENKRLMELSQDLQHRPIVFIRFNPDKYTDKDGKIIKSCWKMNKLGVLTISKQKEWCNRLIDLKNEIRYWIENNAEKTVEIIQLFF